MLDSSADILAVYGWEKSFFQKMLPWLEAAPHRKIFFVGEGLVKKVHHPKLQIFILQTPLQIESIALKIGRLAAFLKIEIFNHSQSPYFPLFQERLIANHLRAQLELSDAADFGVPHVQNAYRNLARPFKSCLDLKGAFSNMAAILVGAGPSLEKQGHLLRSLQNKALIFAGGSALGKISYPPHFGACIDKSSPIKRSFLGNFPLCFQARMHPENFKDFQGDALLAPDSHFSFLNSISQSGETFNGGWTVGNFMAALAVHFGCNPIICIGMDYCYDEGKKYAFEDAGQEEGLVLAEDMFKAQVWTQNDWLMARDWMEGLAKEHADTTFYNANGSGLAYWTPLFLENFSPEEIPNLQERIDQKVRALPIKSCLPKEAWRSALIQVQRKIEKEEDLEEDDIAQEMLFSLWKIWRPIFEREVDPYELALEEKMKMHKKVFFTQVIQEHLQQSNLQTIYWDHGEIKRSIEFQNGMRSGFDRMWNEEGVLVDERFYQEGKPSGTHRMWNGKGVLIEEIVYMQEKQFDIRRWDEKGILRHVGFWTDDLHYTERVYDPLKDLWVEKKGKWSGKQILFDETPAFHHFSEIPTFKTQGDFSKAYALLIERFPKMAFSILESAFKEVPLECIQDCSIGKAEAVYVYGMGCGAPYFQLKSWLHEKSNRVLVFLEDDVEVLSYFLHLEESLALLSDSQVYIELLNQNINDIAETFAFHKIEVFSIPSKQGAYFKSLKVQLFRKTTLFHALQMDQIHGDLLFDNFLKNVSRMGTSFYANKMKGAFKNLPAIICGAGPSLNQAIPLLKKLSDKAILIAGGSTLAALSSQGVPIHFGMAVDPNLEEYQRLKNNFALTTPMLYSTRVHPSLFQTCGGPFGYMRSGIGGVLEVWMEEESCLSEDPLIGGRLSLESLSVTTVCTAWAEFIGCTTILFAGVDLSYSEEKRYAEGVGCEGDLPFSLLDAQNVAPDRILKRKDPLGRPVYTATRWVMEAASLGNYAKKHKKISFFNTSETGLKIPNVPFLKLEKAAEIFLQQSYNIEAMIQEKISSCKMPENTEKKIKEKIAELEKSIERVIELLEVVTKKKPGSSVLAELDLEEELAMDLIFRSALKYLRLPGEVSCPQWGRLLDLAKKYQNCFPSSSLCVH